MKWLIVKLHLSNKIITIIRNAAVTNKTRSRKEVFLSKSILQKQGL